MPLPSEPPPAAGVRLDWAEVPPSMRRAIEQWLGSTIVSVTNQRGGFSPGVAARVEAANGRRVFIKVGGPRPNPDMPSIYRRELGIAAALPADAPVPRLLWSYDEGGWVAMIFEYIDGRQPVQPWRGDELDRVTDALVALSIALTPSPLPAASIGTAGEVFSTNLCGWRRLRDEQPSQVAYLDSWSSRNLDALVALEMAAPPHVAGNTLLNLDVRADNILLTADRVWFVDWPLACIGAAWVDVVFFAPSVTMQGGPPPEKLIARHPACQTADPDAITAAVAAVAGFFTHRAMQPPPPGLPTVRAFQAAQGVVARRWVAERAGLSLPGATL
jgi:aminoglycoside phosphotransferase (APT) family kinase protein